MVRFNRTHSFLNLQAKFFKFTFCTLAKFPVNYANFVQFSPKNPANHAKFAPFIDTLYIMFQMPAPAESSQNFQRIMQIPRNLPT